MRQEPSLEHCVTLDPEPQCDDETHGEILNTVFKEAETEMQTESRILFPERSQQTANQGNQFWKLTVDSWLRKIQSIFSLLAGENFAQFLFNTQFFFVRL